MRGIAKLTVGVILAVILLAAFHHASVVESQEGGDNYEITRTATTDTVCINTTCNLIIYSTPVNMKNATGDYIPFTDVVDFSWNGDLDAFNLSWFQGYVIIRPEIVASNGNNYTISDLKTLFPEVNFKEYLYHSKHYHKFGLNFTNIPSNLMDKVDYIKLSAIESQGITLNNITLDKDNHRLLFFDKVVLDYNDLLDSNFILDLESKTSVLIGNVTNKSNLWLDPTIELDQDVTEVPNDMSMRDDGSEWNIGSNYCGYFLGAAYRVYIQYNITNLSALSDITILNATISQYKSINDGAGETNVSVYHVLSQIWANVIDSTAQNESNMTWENQTCGSAFDNSTNCNLAALDQIPVGVDLKWYNWSVTSALETEYAASNNFVSFAFKTNEVSGSPLHYFDSAEGTNKPLLNITYSTQTINWTTNQSSTPTYYNPDTISSFNVTWTTNSGSVDSVVMESNWSGVATNYTMIEIVSGIYNYNLTLPAGSFYWKSYAQGDELVTNITDQWNLTIGKNQTNGIHINVTLSGTNHTDQNVSAESDDTLNTTCWINISDSGSCNLYYNNASVSSPHVQTHGVGTQSYFSNTSGNTNYTSNTSGITIWLNISEAVITGGGGGGGGGDSAVCGNGYCEDGEDPLNCPEDCEKAGWDYIILPSAGVIAAFTAPGAIIEEQISILNPNAEMLPALIKIECDGGDPSCDWLWLIDNESIEQKTLQAEVAAGLPNEPTRLDIPVRMTVPKEIELTSYKALITVNSYGVKKTIVVELRDSKGFGVLDYLWKLLNTVIYTWNGIQITFIMVLLPILLVIILAYSVQGRKLRKRMLQK